METENIEYTVKQILHDLLGIPMAQMKPTDRLIEELGADSFGMLSIRATIEERFKILIPDKDVLELLTVDRIIKYISRRKSS